MVKIDKVPSPDGKGFTIVTTALDVEYVDPLAYFRTLFVEPAKAKRREMLRIKNPPFPMSWLEPVIIRHAEKAWEDYYQKLMSEKVPDFLFSALKADNKKYQERFLRGMQFTPNQLAAFYLRAHQEYGYTFSSYSSEHLPAGIDIGQMPALVRIDGEKVFKVGETTLKDGELRQAITQRSAIYGKILDKGESFHCFFATIESIAGKENWKDGQPHYHYISDKFGIPREEVVKQLKNKDYKLFNLPHLELHGYRDTEELPAADLSQPTPKDSE